MKIRVESRKLMDHSDVFNVVLYRDDSAALTLHACSERDADCLAEAISGAIERYCGEKVVFA